MINHHQSKDDQQAMHIFGFLVRNQEISANLQLFSMHVLKHDCSTEQRFHYEGLFRCSGWSFLSLSPQSPLLLWRKRHSRHKKRATERENVSLLHTPNISQQLTIVLFQCSVYSKLSSLTMMLALPLMELQEHVTQPQSAQPTEVKTRDRVPQDSESAASVRFWLINCEQFLFELVSW